MCYYSQSLIYYTTNKYNCQMFFIFFYFLFFYTLCNLIIFLTNIKKEGLFSQTTLFFYLLSI